MIEFVGLGLAGFMMLFGFAVSILSFALVVYAVYDLVFKQPDISDIEKIFWLVIILVFNLIGAIVYLALSYSGKAGFMDNNDELDELERLAELRDKEAITEEEFEEMKEKLLKKEEKNISDPDTGKGLKYLFIGMIIFFLLLVTMMIIGLGFATFESSIEAGSSMRP